MPQNVRNFWVDTQVDGRDSKLASGPVAKDGGFYTTIKIRRDGEVSEAVTINGIALPDGTLEIRVCGLTESGNVCGRFTVHGKR